MVNNTIKKTYLLKDRPKSVGRKLIVLIDGTWNDENGEDNSGVVTNVVKLYRVLEGDSENQIARYFRGVGNDDDFGFIEKTINGATGGGEKKIRQQAYSAIAKEYREGDKILIFGFSRGAAGARMLSSDLNEKGIPEEITITYKISANKQSNAVENRFESYTSSGKVAVDVAFLGVWDTVGAFGIPMKLFGIPFNKFNLFRNMHVAGNVKKAVHLVCADDTRNPFVPTLMNYKPGVVHEVWFPGVHSDVGGGYKRDQLGWTTLMYMIDQLNEHLAASAISPLKYNDEILSCYQQLKDQTDEYYFHFHGLGYKKSIREIHVLENDKPSKHKPLIHQSVFDLQKSKCTYIVVVKKRWFRSDKESIFRIQYNPANVKSLDGHYAVDKGWIDED